MNCDEEDYSEELQKSFVDHYYDAGVFGSVVLGVVFVICIWRLVRHILKRSRTERIGLHFVSYFFIIYRVYSFVVFRY